jgi:hypothetical protein
MLHWLESNLLFRELVDQHPEVLEDRFQLSFFRNSALMSDVASTFRQQGVVMLRGVLEPSMLAASRRSFAAFARGLGRRPQWARMFDKDDGPSAEWANGETAAGSWHQPWVVRNWLQRPAASIIAALVSSWAWPLVEDICDSSDIAITLGQCQARHAIDVDLGVGAHQDAKVLPALAPFAFWIPLHDVIPRRTSGLGFVTGFQDDVNSTLPNNDIGQEALLAGVDRIWVPEYRAGDISAHANLLPHFTTGYGTGTDRYSLEVRAVARRNMRDELDNPGVFVSRIHGVPRIVGGRSELPVKARSFLRAFGV